MALKLSNNATSTLAANINAAATTLAIQSADEARFPLLSAGDWFPVTVVDAAGNMEVMRCTARVGVTFTVVRAQEGTTAKNFSANSRIDVRLTAGALAEFGQLSGAAFTGPISGPSATFTAISSPSLDEKLDEKLDKASNLSDLPNKETARSNLGADDASNLTTGAVAESLLPRSVYPNLIGSTDATTSFNDLTSPGWQPAIYKGTNPNGPGDGNWYFVENIVWTSSITQIAIHYSTPATTIAMRGRYGGNWTAWTKFVTPTDLSAALASYAPLSGAVFTGNISARRVSTYGDTYSYLSFLNAARDTEKAYIGIAQSPWNDLIAAVGAGDIYLRKGGVNKFMVSSNYNLSYNNLIVTGNAPDYGISGTPGSSAFGGVIGWSADHNSYGILGYDNAYSFYGKGQVYNKGDALIDGLLTITGNIKNNGSYIGTATLAILGTLGPTGTAGAVYLRPNGYNDPSGQTYIDYYGTMRVANHFYAASSVNAGGDVIAGGVVNVGGGASYIGTNGNIYGSAWGGYLSTYLGNTYATPTYVAAKVSDVTSSMTAGAFGSYALLTLANTNVSANPGDGWYGSDLRFSTAGGTGGSAPSGSWRCMGRASSFAGNSNADHATLWLRYA